MKGKSQTSIHASLLYIKIIPFPGLRSNHPREACEHYYFSPHTWTSSILVAENRSSSCPFSGSYKVDGQVNHLVNWFATNSPPNLPSQLLLHKLAFEENLKQTNQPNDLLDRLLCNFQRKGRN